MANKMTKRDYFNKLKGMVSDPELIAFIDNELALLAKKNGAKKAPTKTQKENAVYKDTILASMSAGVLYAVAEIADMVDSDLSNQKVSALLTQLVNDGKVVRVVEKRKAYFKKA